MDAVATYRQAAVTTQSKGRIIVMLYDGAVKFLKLAAKAIEEHDYAGKGHYLNKALDIIDELNMSLDMEAGGEISQNLRKLYVFMGGHLGQANTKSDAKMVREVIALLEELNQGWRAIAD